MTLPKIPIHLIARHIVVVGKPSTITAQLAAMVVFVNPMRKEP